MVPTDVGGRRDSLSLFRDSSLLYRTRELLLWHYDWEQTFYAPLTLSQNALLMAANNLRARVHANMPRLHWSNLTIPPMTVVYDSMYVDERMVCTFVFGFLLIEQEISSMMQFFYSNDDD